MKIFEENKSEDNHFKSVLMAYFILVLHVLLIAGLIAIVIFFRGVVNYMIWIFLVGTAVIIASGSYFYRRLKREGKTLKEMLRLPLLTGRTVEVSVLGGLASFKIGTDADVKALVDNRQKQSQQLEDPETVRVRELSELARMLENDLITLDEYNTIKHQIIKS